MNAPILMQTEQQTFPVPKKPITKTPHVTALEIQIEYKMYQDSVQQIQDMNQTRVLMMYT